MRKDEYDTSPKIEKIEKDVFFTTFGNNTRLELKNGMFGKGKLAILLQKLDDHNKQLASMILYIDLPKALVMANDIISGRFARLAKDPSQITSVFKDMGGQPPERAKRRDGKALYRELEIQKGRLWIFKGVTGPGKVTDTGGFAPDGKAETMISVGMDNDTIKMIALMIQNEYVAYRTAQMLRCDYA